MFNEALALPTLVGRLIDTFDRSSTEIFLVDDASSDDSAGLAERLTRNHENFHVLRLPQHRGKGAALRAGFARTTADAVIFMDADLSTSLEHIEPFLSLLASHDIVIGSRSVPGSSVERSNALRTAMGRTFNRLMRKVTDLDVHDSQCGFKAYRGDVGRLVFALSRTDRFAIDPETLRLATALGYSVEERPVHWVAGERSAVRPIRDSLRAAVDLCIVRLRTPRRLIHEWAGRSGLPVPAPVASTATGTSD